MKYMFIKIEFEKTNKEKTSSASAQFISKKNNETGSLLKRLVKLFQSFKKVF